MQSLPHVRAFAKEILIKGHPVQIRCIEMGNQTFSLQPGLVSTVALEDEWFDEVRDPEAVIETLKAERVLGADLFSFCQRLPHTERRYAYDVAMESIAAVRLESYSAWWDHQIEKTTRNQIRKCQKVGVEIRPCAYDDEFIRGMTAIFNETPVRQGRRFWHYGKDFETIKRQFARNLFREELFGAFYRGEMIGFAMLGKSNGFADLGQIIAKLEHRDKSVTSALIATAVERCCVLQLPYLVYAYWSDDSLGQFKRRLGFDEVLLPRYFVPLTWKGRLALYTGTHRGWRTLMPPRVKSTLRRWRSTWYTRG